MFWGLVLEPSKKYTQKVDQTFHISQAALDLQSYTDSNPVQLLVEYENSNFVLATLSLKHKIFQVPLDLIFKTGDQVSFRTIGNGKVHLSGYHVLEDLDSVLLNGEEEGDLEEIEEISKNKGKRKKPAENFKGKKLKLEELNEDDSEDDDLDDDDDEDLDDEEDDSEDEDLILEKKGEKKKQKGNSLLDSMAEVDEEFDEEEDEDDEDEDDDDDDEEDEEEDEDEEFDFADSDELSMEVDDDTGKKKNKVDGKKNAQTPKGVQANGKDKTPQKLNKSLKQATPKKDGKTPKSEKKGGNAEGTPQKKNSEGQKKEEKTPKTPKTPKPEGSPQKKVLEGGVISEEIKVGNGPVAKPGKMVNVYYVGTLASSKSEFDSVRSGAGFKFRLGRNEVIKGWDIGINGMKVGGKRKLTIPPQLAYGSRGSPPVIPPNSTLEFTVELKSLS